MQKGSLTQAGDGAVRLFDAGQHRLGREEAFESGAVCGFHFRVVDPHGQAHSDVAVSRSRWTPVKLDGLSACLANRLGKGGKTDIDNV